MTGAGHQPLRNGQLVRVLRLLRMLEVRGRFTLEFLAGELQVSSRTVRRDLDALLFSGYHIDHSTEDDGVTRWFLSGNLSRRIA